MKRFNIHYNFLIGFYAPQFSKYSGTFVSPKTKQRFNQLPVYIKTNTQKDND